VLGVRAHFEPGRSGEARPTSGVALAGLVHGRGELDVVRQLVASQEAASGVPGGERWIGDDAAVLEVGPPILLAADALVEGVHFDRSLSSLADVGWKAVAVNVSDVAAMGGAPARMVATVAAPRDAPLAELFAGIMEAAEAFRCPLVGGDLSAAPLLMVSVSILGSLPDGPAIGRDGGRPGDVLAVSGPLGASAAGLRLLRSRLGVEISKEGPAVRASSAGQAGNDLFPAGSPEAAAVAAHRRPMPRLSASFAARRGGATAMIDLSDGLVLDASRVAEASGVAAILEDVPTAEAATRSEALAGGEDYELLIATASFDALSAAFAEAGLGRPFRVGHLEAGSGLVLDGALGDLDRDLVARVGPGFEHQLRW